MRIKTPATCVPGSCLIQWRIAQFTLNQYTGKLSASPYVTNWTFSPTLG